MSIIKNFIENTVVEITSDDLKGCSKIRQYAFYGKATLKSITIPYSVSSIEDYAFMGCTNLETIKIENKNSIINIDTSDMFYSQNKIYVPYDLYYSYRIAPHWKNIITQIFGYKTVSIGEILNKSTEGNATNIWYPTILDLKNNTNSIVGNGINTATVSGEWYCSRNSEIVIFSGSLNNQNDLFVKPTNVFEHVVKQFNINNTLGQTHPTKISFEVRHRYGDTDNATITSILVPLGSIEDRGDRAFYQYADKVMHPDSRDSYIILAYDGNIKLTVPVMQYKGMTRRSCWFDYFNVTEIRGILI